MKVFIRSIKGKSVDLNVDPEDKVHDLKRKIQDKEATWKVELQKLIYQRAVLDDSKTLNASNIVDNSTIFLVLQSASKSQNQEDNYGITLKSGDTPLILQEMTIRTTIAVGTSETIVDMIFFNNAHKTAEGELDIPIPENAVVCGYSYEYQGNMIPASVVEKEQARITFEKEVRSGGAVSLVEHVVGNNFKVRVYPLEPNKTKKVSVAFVNDLEFSADKLHYYLPFLVMKELKQLTVDIRVLESGISQVHSEFSGLEFKKEGEWYQAHVSSTNTLISLPIALSVTPYQYDEITHLSSFENNDFYFLIDEVPPYPDKSTSGTTKKGKYYVLWDASYSLEHEDHKTSIKLLEKLSQMTDDGVDVVVFRNEPEPVESFSIEKCNNGSLTTFLNNIIYDGGTDLERLPFPETGKYSKILWFTDGLSTLSANLPKTLPEIPVYVFVDAGKTNTKPLAWFSRSTGGNLYNLRNSDIEEIVNQVMSLSQFQFLSASFDSNEIENVFPNQPTVLKTGQNIRIFGCLKSKKAEISLKFGFDNSNVTHVKSVILDTSKHINTTIIPRLWAQQLVDDLNLIDTPENKEKMLNIGRKFGIVTPGASLLVLTTLEQYLQHNIEPSEKILPSVYNEWKSRKITIKEEKELKIKNKLNNVYTWWKKREEWYEKNYEIIKKDTNKTKKNKKEVIKKKGKKKVKTDDIDSFKDKKMDSKKEMVKTEKISQKQEMEIQKEKIAPMKEAKLPVKKKSVASSKSSAPAPAPAPKPVQQGENAIMQLSDNLEKCLSTLSEPMSSCKKKAYIASSSSSSSVSSPPPSGIGMASINMSVRAWTPDRPYINDMKQQSSIQEKYNCYIKNRGPNSQSPAFFLDVAHYFIDVEKEIKLGIRILTTLGDIKLEDSRILRIIANKLSQEGHNHQALWLFEKVSKLRPEEPQSHRELALAHRAVGNYQRCIDLLWKVVCDEWPLRFQHIEDEVLLELNHTIWDSNTKSIKLDTSAVESRFLKQMPMDIHCTITWDTDDLCIDLHIDEPTGYTCCYHSHITNIGGWSTPDYSGCTAYSTSMLREYMIKRAMEGKYTLGCNYYSNYRQDLTGGAIIWFTVYTNYSTEKEKKMSTTLRLDVSSTSPGSKSKYTIGEVNYENK